MEEICETRDYCRLHGGSTLAKMQGFQDLRSCHRWNAWARASPQALSRTIEPISPNVNRPPLSEPELDASKELLDLANRIMKMDKDSFCKAFELWYDRYIKYYNNDRIKLRLGTSPVKFRELCIR